MTIDQIKKTWFTSYLKMLPYEMAVRHFYKRLTIKDHDRMAEFTMSALGLREYTTGNVIVAVRELRG